MTTQEQQNINRLIETGTPENLSLAYHLMVGMGMDEVDAIMDIIDYNGRVEEMYMSELILKVGEWDIVVMDGVDCARLCIVDCYDEYCFGMANCLLEVQTQYFYNWDDAARTMLTQTRHIWQDKI